MNNCSGARIVIFTPFSALKFDSPSEMSIFDQKELPQPLKPLPGAESPLTRLFKTAFTFTVARRILAHEPNKKVVSYHMKRGSIKIFRLRTAYFLV